MNGLRRSYRKGTYLRRFISHVQRLPALVCCHFTDEMLKANGKSFKGQTVVISGSR